VRLVPQASARATNLTYTEDCCGVKSGGFKRVATLAPSTAECVGPPRMRRPSSAWMHVVRMGCIAEGVKWRGYGQAR